MEKPITPKGGRGLWLLYHKLSVRAAILLNFINLAKILMAIKNTNVNYVSGNSHLSLLKILRSQRGILNAQSAVKLLLFTMTISIILSIDVSIKSVITPFLLLKLMLSAMLPVNPFMVR